nr:U37231r39-II protein [Apopellia endiviifolia (species B)]
MNPNESSAFLGCGEQFIIQVRRTLEEIEVHIFHSHISARVSKLRLSISNSWLWNRTAMGGFLKLIRFLASGGSRILSSLFSLESLRHHLLHDPVPSEGC